MNSGTVYTETIVHSAPEAFLSDAPYQLAIIELDGGGRVTARLEGPRASIGDRVEYIGDRNGVPWFRRILPDDTP